MRNRKAYVQPKAEETKTVSVPDTKLAEEVRELRATIERALASGSKEAPDLEALLASIEKLAQRPRKIAIEVLRDGENRVTGMVAHTDAKDIERITKRKARAGGLDDWIKESMN